MNEQFQTIGSVVYRALREGILEGSYNAGDSLKPHDLAKQLGISSVPAREALLRLCAEGLLEVKPRKGIVVPVLSEEEVTEIMEIRLLLEPYTAGRACEKMKSDDIEELESIFKRMGETNIESRLWLKHDRQFHNFLGDKCGNKRLANIIENLRGCMVHFFKAYRVETPARKHSTEDHLRIIKACKKRDPEEARRAMKDHLLEVFEELKSHYKTIKWGIKRGPSDLTIGKHGVRKSRKESLLGLSTKRKLRRRT